MQLNKYIIGENSSLREKFVTLYNEAFPECERKPFEIMEEKTKVGSVELLSIEADSGEFLGFAFMLIHDGVALLDYFAISPDCRGGGIGTSALMLLKERYRDYIFLIEIEDTDDISAGNIDDRIRRKNFYLKCGMVEMPYKVWFFGVKMQVLTCGKEIAYASHQRTYREVLGVSIANRVTLA